MGVLAVCAGPSLAAAPANDNFAQATVLSGSDITLSGQTNAGATDEPGEPAPAGTGSASVWYAWTAPHTGDVTIDTCNSADDTTLAVYTGSSVNALSEVASNDDACGSSGGASMVTFKAVGGTTYRIAVAGYRGGTVAFALHLFQQPPPANDDFAAATLLMGGPVDLAGQSTATTSGQPGEPNHAGVSLGAGCSSATVPNDGCLSSVWYTWSSPDRESVTIDLCDASTTLDTTLGVYTGAAVNALSEVASNDDVAPACPGADQADTASRVTFTASAGTTYRIAVAGVHAQGGGFALHLRTSPPPPLPPPAQAPAAPPAASSSTQPVVAPKPAAVVSNAFSFGSVRSLSDGSVYLAVKVSGPGVVYAFDSSARSARGGSAGAARRRRALIKPLRVSVRRAGSVTLPLRPTSAARRLLRRKGSVAVVVRVTFTPTGGAARTKTKRVTLKIKRRRARQ